MRYTRASSTQEKILVADEFLGDTQGGRQILLQRIQHEIDSEVNLEMVTMT